MLTTPPTGDAPRRDGSLPRREDGITLIELLVAVLVLAIGILATMTTLIDSGKATQTTQRQSQAFTIAGAQVEAMRGLKYSSLATDSNTYSASPLTLTADSSADGGYDVVTPDGNQTEQMVLLVSGNGFHPVSYIDASTGTGYSACSAVPAGDTCATIYRYVTWAPQKCPVINLATLLGPASTSGSLLNGLASLSTTVSGLTSSIAVDSGNPLLGKLLNPLLITINGQINTLDSSLLPSLTSALSPLTSALSTPLTNLQTAIGKLPASNLLTLDLCSMPNINLESIAALQTALSSASNILNSTNLSGTLSSIQSILATLNTANPLLILGSVLSTITSQLNTINTSTLPTTISSINSTLSSLTNELGSTSSLTSIVNDLTTNVQSLVTWLTSPAVSTVKQSKRIIVGVVLNGTRNGVGIRNPVWESTIVTDPSAGLL